jgi:hypothetical protein
MSSDTRRHCDSDAQARNSRKPQRSAAQRSARMRFAVDQKSWTTCAERHSLQCVDRVSQSLRLRLHDYARIALQECPMLLGGIKGAQEGAH